MRKTVFSIFLLSVCCFVGNDALGHTVQAREVHAVIESIDFQKRTLTLVYPQRHGPWTVIWKTDTQFLRGRKPVTVAELKEGTPVTVYFHSPFLGKPFVTKMVWDDGN